jgi:hypothetical protein
MSSITGRFRSDMIAAAGVGRDAVPAQPAAQGVSPSPYPNWLDRVQRSGGRHAAITKNLYSWSNYKNWADQIKNSWDPKNGKPK